MPDGAMSDKWQSNQTLINSRWAIVYIWMASCVRADFEFKIYDLVGNSIRYPIGDSAAEDRVFENSIYSQVRETLRRVIFRKHRVLLNRRRL
jgi:hypothetical protein